MPDRAPLLVVTAHPGVFVWRAAGAIALAIAAGQRGVQAKRNSGPNLRLPVGAYAEAYQRLYPQVTDVLA